MADVEAKNDFLLRVSRGRRRKWTARRNQTKLIFIITRHKLIFIITRPDILHARIWQPTEP